LNEIANLQRFGVKLFAQKFAVGQQEIIPIFHRWIQQQWLPGHLLIDVAEYTHVHHGPGIVLVGHEANISTDENEGKAGLQYLRKQPQPGDLGERITSVLRTTLTLAERLEREPELAGRLQFDRHKFVFIANDRLLAPNTAETFEALRETVSAATMAIAGGDRELTLSRHPQEKGLLRILVEGKNLLPSSLAQPANA